MSGSALNQDELDECLKEAEEQGFEIIKGDGHTLLLDLDHPAAEAQYERVFAPFNEHFGPCVVDEWVSKSGHKHVRIKIDQARDPLPYEERYALQAAMGSDGVRETLALVQMQNGCDEASILFKPTWEVKPHAQRTKRSLKHTS